MLGTWEECRTQVWKKSMYDSGLTQGSPINEIQVQQLPLLGRPWGPSDKQMSGSAKSAAWAASG